MNWLTAINSSCIVVLTCWLLCNTGLNSTAIDKVEKLELVVNTIQSQQKDTIVINNNINIPQDLSIIYKCK